MWIWKQDEGELWRDSAMVSKGYSGKGRGVNNPALQNVRGVGPIPKGDWRIMNVYNSKNVGPFVLTLWRKDSKLDDYDDTTGRSAFRIHGDSIRAPGTASKGCIILPRQVRERIWKSGDRDLRVV
jgi:hypothetical protein